MSQYGKLLSSSGRTSCVTLDFPIPSSLTTELTLWAGRWWACAPSIRSPTGLTPYYPQGNDQAEISNRTILDSLWKILDKAKGKWVEKLSGVLWAHGTTKRVPMGETPFSLAYGMKAIIPVDICMPTLHTTEIDQSQNVIQLDLAKDQ